MGKKAKEQRREMRAGYQSGLTAKQQIDKRRLVERQQYLESFNRYEEQERRYQESLNSHRVPKMVRLKINGFDISETVLTDDYPVFPGYTYIIDDHVVESPLQGNVSSLKAAYVVDYGSAKIVRRYQLYDRKETIPLETDNA